VIEKPKKEFNVSCSDGIGKGEYCLSIEIENVHTDLSTSYYEHCIGNRATFNAYGMTYEEIAELAGLILSKVFEVREREKK